MSVGDTVDSPRESWGPSRNAFCLVLFGTHTGNPYPYFLSSMRENDSRICGGAL